MTTLKNLMIVGALLVGGSGPFSAAANELPDSSGASSWPSAQLSAQSNSQVSEQERGACRQDVRKFCQAELQRNPDDMLSITGCLQANRTKISRVCRNALARNGQ